MQPWERGLGTAGPLQMSGRCDIRTGCEAGAPGGGDVGLGRPGSCYVGALRAPPPPASPSKPPAFFWRTKKHFRAVWKEGALTGASEATDSFI